MIRSLPSPSTAHRIVGLALVTSLFAACSTSHHSPSRPGGVEMPEPDVRVIPPETAPRERVSKKPAKPRKGPAPRWEKDRGPEDHEVPSDIELTPDPEPTFEPHSRGGNAPSYTVFGKRYHTLDTAEGYKEQGLASWYGKKFHGRKTSNGEDYDMFELTAAHKTLPLPTYAWVTNLDNGKRVIVRINDRGPFHPGRIIDLSYAAAARLDCIGVIPRVEVEAITPKKWRAYLRERDQPSAETTAVAMADEVLPRKTGYLWQVGAYRDAINAVQAREKLSGHGFESVDIRVGTNSQGEDVHLVLVGPFSNRRQVERAQLQIRAIGFEPMLVKQ